MTGDEAERASGDFELEESRTRTHPWVVVRCDGDGGRCGKAVAYIAPVDFHPDRDIGRMVMVLDSNAARKRQWRPPSPGGGRRGPAMPFNFDSVSDPRWPCPDCGERHSRLLDPLACRSHGAGMWLLPDRLARALFVAEDDRQARPVSMMSTRTTPL